VSQLLGVVTPPSLLAEPVVRLGTALPTRTATGPALAGLPDQARSRQTKQGKGRLLPFSLPFIVATAFVVISMAVAIVGIGYASYYAENADQAFSYGLSIALGFITSGAIGLYLLADQYLVQQERSRLERNRSLEALRQLQEELNRCSSMEAVSAGLAHEFNNCIQPLYLGLDALEPYLSTTTAQSLVPKMRRALDAAIQLTQSIGEDRRAKSSPDQWRLLSLEQLVRDFAELLSPNLPPTIAVEVRGNTGEHQVKGSAACLLRVLQNLTANARDAMPGGGLITLSLGRTDGNGQPHLTLSCTDTGVGMKPEVQAQAFTPFYTTKSRGRGTGLGLSQVRRIVKQHRGEVCLESRLGAGTRVTVALPIAPADSE
jgi:signal transduction histidine kinase